MNTDQRRPLLKYSFLKLLFLALSIILIFYFARNQYTSQVQHKQVLGVVQNESIEYPVRLTIPIINVDSKIQRVGLTPNNDMDVPSNTTDVGWFELGTLPGQIGSAVIDGHIDGTDGERGVFADLHKLKPGDNLYIKNNKGISITFVVRESRVYDPGHVQEVFGPNDSAHLNLVTCDGVWDEAKKSYSKRLVVFTDLENGN